jgi:putative phosphoribosyl transferase
MTTFFRDRKEAGKLLAEKLSAYAGKPDIIVSALPRGGVPLAFEIAKALHAPLDLMLVRKLGVPGHEELALGALAMDDVCVFNDDVIRSYAIPDEILQAVIAKESKELLRRNQAYRGGAPPADVKDRTVILVDDGLATGATMHAAVRAVAQQGPARIIIAVPVASEQAVEALRREADEVVCLQIPPFFYGVGSAYGDFSQTTDDEVKALMEEARHIIGFEYAQAGKKS